MTPWDHETTVYGTLLSDRGYNSLYDEAAGKVLLKRRMGWLKASGFTCLMLATWTFVGWGEMSTKPIDNPVKTPIIRQRKISVPHGTTRWTVVNGTEKYLRNVADTEYLAKITIGSPPVEFEVIVDTGSAELWVAGVGCTGCGDMTTYNMTKSSSWTGLDRRFHIVYGTGYVYGVMGEDAVAVSGVGARVMVGVATRVSSFFTSVPYADGILGLGPPMLSKAGTQPFLTSLRRANSIDALKFSISLSPTPTLSFGSPPASKAATLRYTPFTSFSDRYFYYVIPIGSWYIDGVKLVTSAGHAIVDSGTSLILGPSSDVDAIRTGLGPGCPTKTLQLEINGYLYTIPPSVYNLGENCTLAVAPSIPGVVILGDPFLRSVYTLFDLEAMQLGIAPHPGFPPATPVPTR